MACNVSYFAGFREFDTAKLRIFSENEVKNWGLPYEKRRFRLEILALNSLFSTISTHYRPLKMKTQKTTQREARPALNSENYYHPLPE